METALTRVFQLSRPLNPARILVHEVNWLGDLVMTLPALAALRRAFPAARLSVLVDCRLAEFFDGGSLVDEVIPLDRAGKRFAPMQLAHAVGQLRARHFDLAIVLPNSFVSALRVALAGIPNRAGFACDSRGWMLTNRTTPPAQLMKRHQMHYWLEMLKATIGVEADANQIAPEVAPHHLERMRGWLATRRNGHSKLVAVAPTAAYGPAKEWPQSHYVALLSSLAQSSVQAVLVGSRSDVARCEAIATAAGSGAIIAAGQTNVGELMALLSLCDGFVGNDSGVAHLASTLGIPTVAIFGSTNPARTGPLGPRTTILYEGVECSPCLARTCRFGHYRCLRDIAAPQALTALENLGALS